MFSLSAFVFDSQFLVQCVHFGLKFGDIPVPVRYFDEASSINLKRSSIYALETLRTFGSWYLNRAGLMKNKLFAPIVPENTESSGGRNSEAGS